MTARFPKFHSPRQSRRGVALLLVLSIVALLTIVVIGFLLSSSMERTAAASYQASSTSQLLADTAVKLVMGQINQATSVCEDEQHAWASQPGAIWVFNNANPSTVQDIYRLYSAPSLITPNATALANDLPPAGWANSPALWVDLNAPVNDASGNAHFPIFDANQTGSVDGFSINAPPGSTATQPCPMPVQWLYVLQQGQILAPDAGGAGTVVTFNNATTPPSASNPIVGRIAYWTDDETCKVNINTAAGDGIFGAADDPTNVANATFWSPPFFCAPDDVLLATNQPASGEFQRYPGHPATVALRNILNSLNFTTTSSAQFYTLTPRTGYGGSEGGKQTVNQSTPVPLNTNPLYSSVAEMLFGPPNGNGPPRPLSAINGNDSLTQKRIETAGFFLTAHSRAPELNLFGEPRVSIWPVWDSSAGQTPTAIDDLLSFCATIKGAAGTYPYYFTRKDPTSSKTDIALSRNQSLLSYLDSLTSQAIPGYGGNFSAKSYGVTGTGVRQILTEIFDYIRSTNVADGNTPVNVFADNYTPSNQYGRSWSGGYNDGQYQVAPSLNSTWGTQGIGIFPRLTEAAIQFVALGSNPGPASNVPLSPNYTTANLKSLGLIGTGDTGTDGNSKIFVSTPATSPATYSTPASTTAVQAFILLQFTNPAQMRIPSEETPFVWVKIAGLNGAGAFTINAHPLFPAGVPSSALSTSTMIYGSDGGANYGDNSFANFGFDNMTPNYSDVGETRTIGSSIYSNTLYSAIIPIMPDAQGKFSFTGGTMTVYLFDANNGNGTEYPGALPTSVNQIQSYTINFPSTAATGFPVPTPEISLLGSSTTVKTTTPPVTTFHAGFSVGILNAPVTYPDRWLLPHNLSADSFGNYNGVICADDTIESMVLSPQWSDPRDLAVSKVPAAAFVQNPLWGSQQAYSLTVLQGAPLNSTGGVAAMGTLVNGIAPNNYAPVPPAKPNNLYSVYPIVSPKVTAGVAGPGVGGSGVGSGDWDNGIGYSSDGPWINKADEGNLYPGAGYPYYSNGQALISTGTAFFSPNREVPSPGMFGSLPSGVDPTGANPQPWQTLLFQPGPPGHLGAVDPKDHLLLDLFWMPVAEPYAISEPFSTAGKVNLNYEIEPFTYITRKTAIRAVLATEKVAAVAGNQASKYKYITSTYTIGMPSNARVPLNLDETLKQFDAKFNGNDIFHSSSQICEEYLVPQGYTAAQFATEWYQTGASAPFALVGDNVRERPYTDIYSRITTKSNSYCVHFTVQALKNPPANPSQWDETKGSIVGEYRGSTILERFIDPNASIPDYATQGQGGPNLEQYYKWRVVENHQFAP